MQDSTVADLTISQWAALCLKSEKSTMKRMTTYLLLSFVVLVGVTIVAGAAGPEEGTKSAAAFKQLSSLVGEWHGGLDGDPTPIVETYALVGNGTAILTETKANGHSEMITMFVIDGNRLIATHYCNARNQPEMVSSDPGDLGKGLTFSLDRITGVKTSPDDWHNTGLTITLDDPDHMTQRWTYLGKGDSGTNVFHYTRVKNK